MNQRNRSVILSFLMTCLIAGAFIYFFALNKHTEHLSNGMFSPNQVMQFDWSDGSRSWTFSRQKDNPQSWQTDGDSARIDSKLDFLSHLNLSLPSAMGTQENQESSDNEKTDNPISDSGTVSKKITVKLKFNSGENWEGSFQNHTFTWQSGPLKNQSKNLTDDESRIFYEGRFAFEPLKFNWCNNKITKIIYSHDEEEINIEQVGSQWEITNANDQSKTIDTATLNAWLEKVCAAPVQSWLDIENNTFGIEDGALELDYLDGTQSEYTMHGDAFLVSEGQVAISPELSKLLEEALDTW